MTGYQIVDLRRAAAAGVRAPSLHNSQPWRFRLRDGAIDVLVDPNRTLPTTDPTGWAARIACGAALLNAELALATTSQPAEHTLRPDPRDPHLIATLRPARPRPPTSTEQTLHTAITRRHSNRQPFLPEPVPADLRADITTAARHETAWLELLIGMTSLSAITEIVGSADRVLRRNTAYQAELTHWTRVLPAPDGVPALAAAATAQPHDLLPQRPYTDHDRAPNHDYEPEPLVAVLGTPGDHPTDQIVAGRALQRVLLTATAAGLATSMISQPIEVPAAREQLRIALGRHGPPQMMLRIGYGNPGQPTPRRPVDDVIVT